MSDEAENIFMGIIDQTEDAESVCIKSTLDKANVCICFRISNIVPERATTFFQMSFVYTLTQAPDSALTDEIFSSRWVLKHTIASFTFARCGRVLWYSGVRACQGD